MTKMFFCTLALGCFGQAWAGVTPVNPDPNIYLICGGAYAYWTELNYVKLNLQNLTYREEYQRHANDDAKIEKFKAGAGFIDMEITGPKEPSETYTIGEQEVRMNKNPDNSSTYVLARVEDHPVLIDCRRVANFDGTKFQSDVMGH